LTASEDVEICDAQLPFAWNGNSYNAEGTYSVTLASAAGCDSVVTLNLFVNSNLTASEDATICDAQLPYTWNGNSYNTAGTYSVTLQNATGCDSVVTLNLIVNQSLASTTDSTVCDAQLPFVWNGLTFTAASSQSVTLVSSAGCDSVATLILSVHQSFTTSISISICEGENYTLPDGISVNISGNYTTTFTSQFGCDSTIITILTVDPQITLTLSNDTSICAGTSIILNASGADDYEWNPAEGLSSASGASVTASPANTTMYVVNGLAGACSASDSVLITILPLPQLSVQPGSVLLCQGDSIQLTASGADTYAWSDTALVDCDTCAATMLYPETSSTLVIEGTLGACSTQLDIPVQVLSWPEAQITADTSICLGDTISLTASGGINYTWSTGDTLSQISISPTNNDNYTLIADNGVCADTTTIEIDVHPLPIAFAGEDTTIRYGTSVQLNAAATGTFTWFPLDQLDCTYCLDPIASPPSTIEYCLNVTNSFGCMAFDCVTITIDTICANMFIPNVFAPDAGGHESNNCFRLYGGDCISTMSLKVYTRWGELVFETGRTGDCWDGTHKGEDLNPGVYIYYLDAELITGEKMNKQGNVTLIR
jgi:gliding motility-associated-like protein